MKKLRQIIILAVSAAVIVLFSFCSGTVMQSVKYSLALCYNSVIPSLFPFFILCEFLMKAVSGAGVNRTVSAFACGLVTGFPTGVKNVCDLYAAGELDRAQAISLLHCTANASPAYMVSFIGICLIGSRTAGIILLLSQTLCAFACAVFFGCFSKRKSRDAGKVINITETACASISNAVTSCLNVCGYIVFFGIVADIAKKLGIIQSVSDALVFLPKEQAQALITGMIEISRGIAMLDFTQKGAIVTAAFITAFSGVSVIMQCISCLSAAKLPKRPLIAGKLVYSVLMPITAGALGSLAPISISGRKENMPVLSFILFVIFITACIFFIRNFFDKRPKRIYNIKR